MAINVDFGRSNDDKRTVNKTFTSSITASASIYGDVSILAPRFLVDYNSTILNCNYCYVATYHRYYYITNVTLSAGNRMIISCSVDPLKSFASEINNLYVTIVRQENAPDSFLPDSCMTPTSNKNIETFVLNNSVFNIRGGDAHSSNNFVLCVAGGYTGMP